MDIVQTKYRNIAISNICKDKGQAIGVTRPATRYLSVSYRPESFDLTPTSAVPKLCQQLVQATLDLRGFDLRAFQLVLLRLTADASHYSHNYSLTNY